MKVLIYNSSENLVFVGTYNEFLELKENHLINDSNRIIFEK